MVAIIMLVVLVMWLLFFVSIENGRRSIPRCESVYASLESIDRAGTHLLSRVQHRVSYRLEEADHTHVVFQDGRKPVIKLCVRDVDGNYFDSYTVMSAFVHELAHIIRGEPGHDLAFTSIESTLMSAARDLGYIGDGSVDASYPCMP